MIHLTIDTPEEMAALGRRIARQLCAGDLVALDGKLGAGKTTLTRGLGDALGVRGTVTSPTFVLARTHLRKDGGAPLVHVDAYRLSSPAELDDLDIDFAGSIVVVEWAAGMLDGISDSVLEVSIERPTGALAAASPLAASPLAAGPLVAEFNAAADFNAAAADELDERGDRRVDESVDDGVEARRVTIAPIGPRWAAHPFR